MGLKELVVRAWTELLWTGSKESVFAIKMVDSPVTTKNYCVIVAYPSAVSKEVSLQRTLMLFEKLGNTERINLSTIRSVISSIFFILDTLFNVKNITSSKDSYKFEPFKCFLSIFTQKKRGKFPSYPSNSCTVVDYCVAR
jgi:hypothetical protein